MIVDRKEAQVRAGERLQFGIGDAGQSALRVLHDDGGVDPEDMAREGEAAQDVVGDPSTCVADHVCFPEVQAQGGEHVDAGVHAGDYGQLTARAGIGHVGSGRGVATVGGQEVVDLRHGEPNGNSLRAALGNSPHQVFSVDRELWDGVRRSAPWRLPVASQRPVPPWTRERG